MSEQVAKRSRKKTVQVKLDVVDRALAELEGPAANQRVIWQPQDGPQSLFLLCDFREIFFGGAAGGGKSDALIGRILQHANEYGSACRAILIRQSYPTLEELEARCLELFTPIWGDKCYKAGTKRFELETANGTAMVRLRAMAEKKDVYKHHGHQFSLICWDELTMWESDWWYEYLLTRLRSPYGAKCSMCSTSNPGGVGHNWVKARFMVDESGRRIPPFTPIPIRMRSGNVHYRIFIPSKLTDNKILMENDPDYIDQLAATADPVMRRALLEGDWDIVAGNAFPEFRREIHVIGRRPLPEGVRVWIACDWGSFRPFCVLWAYMTNDGQMVIFHELYGKGEKPNRGNDMPASEVKKLIERVNESYDIRPSEGWLDPQCWAAEPGTASTYELLGGAKFGWKKWGKGKDSRKNQKQAVHEMLKVVNDRSRLAITDNCENLIQCLSTIGRDENDVEDVDTDAEDHAYDALRGLICKKGLTRRGMSDVSDFAKAIREYNASIRYS